MDEIKNRGSDHYKTEKNIQPIDLYNSGNMLRDFALASIIKYAFRNRLNLNKPISQSDLDKIKHYCDILTEYCK